MSDIFVLKREAGGEPFRFQVGDDVFEVKHVRDLDQFALADLFASVDNDVQFVASLLRLGMADSDVERLRALDPSQPEFGAIHKAYMAHCGMKNEGESAASSS